MLKISAPSFHRLYQSEFADNSATCCVAVWILFSDSLGLAVGFDCGDVVVGVSILVVLSVAALWDSLHKAGSKTQESRLLRPKGRVNSEFEDGLNEATNIVTQHLTKSLIDLRGLGLTSKAVTELCLDHRKGSFDVTAFVILVHKPALIQLVVAVHLPPNFTLTIPFVLLGVGVVLAASKLRPRY